MHNLHRQLETFIGNLELSVSEIASSTGAKTLWSKMTQVVLNQTYGRVGRREKVWASLIL
jgi:hypothetical protein